MGGFTTNLNNIYWSTWGTTYNSGVLRFIDKWCTCLIVWFVILCLCLLSWRFVYVSAFSTRSVTSCTFSPQHWPSSSCHQSRALGCWLCADWLDLGSVKGSMMGKEWCGLDSARVNNRWVTTCWINSSQLNRKSEKGSHEIEQNNDVIFSSKEKQQRNNKEK